MQFNIPSCVHTLPNGDNGNTTLTLQYSCKVMVTCLVQVPIVNKDVNTQQKHSVCLNMILGISQVLYDQTIRVSWGNKSSLWWLRRALQTQHKCLMTEVKTSSLPLHIELTLLCVAYHDVGHTAASFPAHPVFGCYHWLNSFFSSNRFLVFCEPLWFSNHGGKWHWPNICLHV